ncbi:enoyl-CoA hydratase-related protein [Sphingopyxis sp. Q841]|uniref:enoyl-CoA hydratase-related protein n=1 Tax=Sphingopyxis sp. Q841 TaxID=3458250 RepID=UPI004035AFBF
MDAETAAAVLTERRGHILIVTINRADARNAVNAAIHVGLGTALKEADEDPEIRAVILTGAGDRSFCAGADLVAISRGEPIEPGDDERRAWGFGGMASHPISKPNIAAVNGYAFGGGFELVLASDLVVAAEHAKFGLPEVKVGLFAAAGGAFRIIEQLPRKIALELLLTGEPFDAETAQRFGFANAVVPSTKLLATAIDLAERICRNAPLSVQVSKRVAYGIFAGSIAGEEPKWSVNSAELGLLLQSEDAHEGPRAFAEKRDPIWRCL